MLQAYAYVLHLLSAFVLLALFFIIYTKITPFEEIPLIRTGNVAAALSLGGAMLGFGLALVSSILHNDTFFLFLAWAGGSMVVQAMAYAVLARIVPNMDEAIEANNIAMGMLMGTTSVLVGMINAACLS
jgi:putative membrane protein